MHVTVIVAIGEGEALAYSPDAAAAQVLVALGGNLETDYCVLTIEEHRPEPGSAGKPPGPPPDASPPEDEP